MRIVIAATDNQWEEWPAGDTKTEWVRVANAGDFGVNMDADAFIDLKEGLLFTDYSELQKPVLINAVVSTLSSLNVTSNVIRINAWPGFLKRPVWEVASKIDDAATKLFEHLDKKITIVADEPGFISARIIAMIINEAYFATGDKVSSREDIDTAMKLGTNYPFGPFEWASAIGAANVLALLKQLSKTDKRYEPAPLLIEEVIVNPT